MSTYNYNYDGNNHNWWEEIIYVLILLVITGVLFMFSSCNPQRKIDKAKQIVLTDSSAFRYVGRKFDELNPCINSVVFKRDTTIKKDTLTLVYNKVDTVNHIDTLIKLITYNNTITIHDTATITDDKKVKLLAEDNNALRLQIASMNGQIIQANAAVKEEHKRGNTFLYYLIAIAVIIAISAGWKIYTAFKPTIKV